MQMYEIQGDLNEERRTNLYLIILLTFLIGDVYFFSGVAGASSDTLTVFSGLWLGGALLLSYLLERKRHSVLASWVYLAGLLGTFSLQLWQYGPSTNLYFCMFLPIVLSALLLNRDGVVRVALLSIMLITVITFAKTNLPGLLQSATLPVFVAGVLAVAIYVNAGNVLEIAYWATNIQKKDAKRAEMFYEQKEQLGEALRQLTHAHTKLEQLNHDLEDARRKAENASQAKSVFLSNMSHELRTPLNVVIGYTSTMLDMPQMYNDVPLPPNYRADIQLIKDNGYYLLGLINDILDLSKIEAGKLELHCTPTSLTEVFQGVVSTSLGLIKEKSLQIIPDFASDLPPVWADPTRVRQIILNLMTNAIKFTPTGSVTLRAYVDGSVVRVEVTDTGIGIPEKALAHIFDRFEQAERDTDKHYGGTGLGLDISRQLARMHGGDLSVRSQVGKGSTFAFTLSIMTEQQAALPEDLSANVNSPAVSPLASTDIEVYTVLVVEDESSMRDMMRRTLESAGHVVVDLQDGAQVIEMAGGLLPDLIVLDVRLPNISGWQLLKDLKRNAETASIPVIICTVADDEERAKELGAELYLRKPFSSDEFLSCVQGLLPYSLEAGSGN
jgi:signal transduction histidine kinase